MHKTGLVSVSFRSAAPEEVVRAAAACDLRHIEWGGDVHAPCHDEPRLREIVRLQEAYGVSCASYGTYFRLALTPLEELSAHIRAAGMLGTDVLRLWAGDKSPQKWTQAERDFLFDQCRQAARIAEDSGVTLCLECHRNTYTETKDNALELMEAVRSPAFRMYWQPHQERTIEANLEYLRLLRPYIRHVHVFQWKGAERFPLRDGTAEWVRYLQELPGEHTLLLEFMPDNRLESLPTEADALRGILMSLPVR